MYKSNQICTEYLCGQLQDLYKCRDIPCSQIGRFSITKMTIISNMIIDSKQSHPKSQQTILELLTN